MTVRADVERVAQLLDGARTVADQGPWVRLRAEAVEEAAPGGGRPARPLDGLAVAVKDLIAVAGLPLGAGSRVRADAAPEPRDAAVVDQLRRAGAVVAGTVALHELAFGVTGVNDRVGFPPHPRDPGRVPGGSSSGSAVAVATGDCDLAVGTDTGGSVRIPAALCGVVGFKPSRGRYSLDGVLPLSPTLDHVGLLARSVETIAVAHTALTGEHVLPGAAAPRPRPRRIGVDRLALEAADDQVAAAVDAALRTLAGAGGDLVDLRWPDPEAVLQVSTTIMFAEAAATHRDLLGGPGRELLGPDVRTRLEAGAAIAEADLAAARRERARIEAEVRATLATVDMAVGPTVPVVAPTIETARTDTSLPGVLVANTRLANVTGVPALTLPLAPADDPAALPAGLQLVGLTDAAVLTHALALGL